jgi:hypothetical protein
MALLSKLSVVAATTTAALLALEMVGTAPAQANLFKFSFTSDEANGYFIFDNSIPARSTTQSPVLAEYFGAAKEYTIDLGEKGVFQGSNGTPIVYLNRVGSGLNRPEEDEFILFVENTDREPPSEFSLSNIFAFPKDSLGSTNLPTTVPTTASLDVRPYVYFDTTDRSNNTIGESVFQGTVQTRVEPIPEPASWFAVFGVGACLILRRRQRRQVQPMQD